MIFKSKREDNEAKTVPLALLAEDYTPLIVFPGEVVKSFRHTLTRLARAGSLPKRVSLVSAVREEGDTYTALALATTIANDQRINVCVVELNWWWPGMIHLITGTNLDPNIKQNGSTPIALTQTPQIQSLGVAGILKRQATPDEALIKTALPNLTLLPAGRLNVEQRPIAARSNELPEILEELDKRFDLLVLDIPPILVTSDAIALASYGEATYMVVRHGATSIENVRTALDDIEHLSVSGVIMNHVRTYTPQVLLRLVSQA